ncbi:MAG TPA: PAS domain S-box protein, partial [Acidobacteriota bacterium]
LALKNFLPDVILSDFRLPKFDAIQALAICKKNAPLIPFIIVTGSISEETAVECMKQGADDYLLKDRLARLGEAVRHSLDKRLLLEEKTRTEATLQDNEKLNRTFIDASTDMAFLKDDKFRHLLVNRELCRFYGKPDKEIIGMTDFQLMGKKAAARCRRSDRQALFGNRVHVSEESAGGLTFETRKFPVRLTDGRMGVGGYIRNISERKRSEDALRESEERYRDLVENSQNLICTHDLQGKLLSVNQAAARLTGYSTKDLLRMNMEELLVPKARRLFKAYLTEILEKGHSRGIMWIQTASGETRYWEYDNTLRSKGVSVPVVRGLAHDITERIQAEKQKEAALTALRESEDRYRDLVENSQELIYTHDLEGKLLSFNKMTAQLSGYPVKNLLGMKITTLLIPEVRQLFDAYLTEIKTSGRAHGHMRIRTAGGENRYWEYDNTLRTKGVPFPIVRGLAHDITERERAEKSIQASLAEKEILLKEIHHRVKNNLQVISGLLTLQGAQINDERLQRLIKESQSRIWTMALIHQTLYQSGNLAAIDMAEYIRTLCGNLLSSYAQVAMPPTIRFDLFPVQLVIDKAIPLALVVNELVTNSLKHAFPDGRPGEIRITLRKNKEPRTSPPVAAYDLIVADDGVGLPSGFDPAAQKSLGLQLVSMLAKQLGGTLAIESDGGTSVTITFGDNEKIDKQS